MQLILDCLPVQFLSMRLLMNCQPGKLLMNFLCSLPGLLGPKMLCLFRVSQCSLGPSPGRGLQVHLLRRGGLLLRSGGLLLRRGGLLLRSGGLPLRLFQSGGLQLCRGGLLPCLNSTQTLFIKHFQHHDWNQSAVQRRIKGKIIIIETK